MVNTTYQKIELAFEVIGQWHVLLDVEELQDSVFEGLLGVRVNVGGLGIILCFEVVLRFFQQHLT